MRANPFPDLRRDRGHPAETGVENRTTETSAKEVIGPRPIRKGYTRFVMCILCRIIAKCTLLFFAVLVAAPAVAQPSSVAEKGDVVWTWSKRCNNNHRLGVKISVDGKVLYRGVLPICRGSRDAEDGRVEVRFAGGHTFQGEYRTRTTDSIEGDIWQAGGEPDALIIGISFDTGKQILLNTVHVANPGKQTSSEVDKGIFITTYPVIVR